MSQVTQARKARTRPKRRSRGWVRRWLARDRYAWLELYGFYNGRSGRFQN